MKVPEEMTRSPLSATEISRARGLLWTLAVLAALIAFVAYMPSLANGFVNWDDPTYVYKNPMIQGEVPGFFGWAFTTVLSGNWHPLTLFSHALDFRIFGLNPWGHHLTSVLLHAFNTLLVFFLTVRLASAYGNSDKEPGIKRISVVAATTALFFALHPLHVESVAWISERKDLLCASFFLLSLIWYLKYLAEERGKGAYALSIIFFALALLSKPMAVSLPIVFLIIDFFVLRRVAELRRAVIEKIPFILLAVGSVFATLWAQGAGGAIVTLDKYSLSLRLLNATRSYAFYLYKAVLPLKLAPYYPHPGMGTGVSGVELAMAVVLLALISGIVLFTLKKWRSLTALWLVYIVTLLPVIGIVQVGAQGAADRYMYLPSIAPFILAGMLLSLAFEQSRTKACRVFAVAIIIFISVSFAVLTKAQAGIWKDSVALWTYEIARYPAEVPIAYTNRGIAHGSEGRIKLAIADFTKAIELKPDHAKAYYNRANAYSIMGRELDAVLDLTSAIEIRPRYARAYFNRAVANANLARYDDAKADLMAVLELQPENQEARRALNKVLMLRGGER